ncbi:hypothetical protein MMC28_002667 [Mycoblastus sanguinarius]|nr:hypothetical protein [Mycoblastus sanguinarius]
MASLLPRFAYGQETLTVPHEDGKYTGSDMDYTYGDAKQKMQSVNDDLRILMRKVPSHAMSLVHNFIHNRNAPSVAGEMVEIAGMLPYNSPIRSWVQAKTVSTLFNSLQHPPASYLGETHQYRTADGSHHSFLFPEFGKAKMPYAKTVRSAKKLHGVRPDPGVLFDLLQARGDNYRENQAGISSMFLYHATILIHDLFNTNREDSNISDTSSYLDLAPLYGSCQKDQDRVRLGKDGLLKPDTFHEDRLLGQPPGVNVLLVLYSRFHNHVATMLKEINEDGRFTLRPNTEKENKQDVPREPEKVLDNDIFQTARLIVNGLYISISLGDYLRAIQGVHEKETTWNFDPRMYIDKTPLGEAVPRGMGNQVSCEFNLLYRFHSAISDRDAKWTEDFFRSLLPDARRNDPKFQLEQLTPADLGSMLGKFAREKSRIEPSKREIEGYSRGSDGKFRDEDLVKILTESIDDTAGAFGAKQVPKALKVIEVAGIVQARKWEVASLNEFRSFFGLEPHKTFKDVNPDVKIQNALENLYDSPDMIEMYPGIFIEELEKKKDTKSYGVGFPATAGRGVLSDAVTLVRSDRFYTIDYTTATLTNWGLCEAASDYNTVAIPLNARFLADLFCLNIKSSNNESGVHSASELYKFLLDIRSWTDTPNPDPAALWYTRRKAQERSVALTNSTSASVAKVVQKPWAIASWLPWGTTAKADYEEPQTVRDLGASIAKTVQADGGSEKDVAQIMWMLAVSGVGAPVTAFAEVLHYFLTDGHQAHWPKIVELARKDTEKADKELTEYFMEAHRLTSEQVFKRTVKPKIIGGQASREKVKIGHNTFEPKQDIILLLSKANKDSATFHNPDVFKLGRKASSYIYHGFGPNGKLGKDMLLAYGTALLKVAGQMGNLRKAPGEMGELKRVQLDQERQKHAQVYGRHYMTPDWGYLVNEPTTWKLHFDSFSGLPA